MGGVPTSCRALTTQSDQEMNRCNQSPRVNEVTEGVCKTVLLLLKRLQANIDRLDLNALPGCNPIQNGPGTATMISNCNAISTTGGAPVPTAPAPPVPTQPPAAPTQPPAVPTQPPPTPANPSSPQQTHFGQCGG